MNFLSISLSAFIIGFFSSIISTGPVNFLVVKNALVGKYGKSFSMLLGAIIMEVIYCTLALTVVSAIFLNSNKVQLFSRTAAILIFLAIGLYLYNLDLEKEISKTVSHLTKREKTKSFIAGFILVVLNPTIILTWSAAITALISFNIIDINNISDVILFVSSAGIGMIIGGICIVSLIKAFKMKLSTKVIGEIIKGLGVFLMTISLYFILRTFFHFLKVKL